MVETVGKQSVRITLLNSGLSPPIFILASFTDPPWEPQEMKHAGVRMLDSGAYGVDSTLAQVEYMFWRRFDIYPGVWSYKYRIGLNDWTICDHNAETGKDLHMRRSRHKLIRPLQRQVAQVKRIMSLESRQPAPHSFSLQQHFRSLGTRHQSRVLTKSHPQTQTPGRVPGRIP